MNALNKIIGFSFLAVLTMNTDSLSQVIIGDSTEKKITQQELELKLEVARIKAKQDSLRIERLRLEQKRKTEVKISEVTENPVQKTQSLKATHPMGKRVIGLNPFHFLLSGLEMSFETVISKRSSIAFTGAYHNMENYDRLQNSSPYTSSSSSASPGNLFLTNNSNSVAYTGVRFQAQYRNYIFQDYPMLTGLYLSPYVMYKQDEVTKGTNLLNYPYTTSANSYQYNQYFAQALGAGVDIGFQVRVLRYFTFNPFVGFGMIVPLSSQESVSEVNIDILNPYKSGMSLRTGVFMGYMF